MAVIRCPACGKPNPDIVEICQYCDARLKPVSAAPSPEAAAPAEQSGVIRCPACGKPNANFLEVCQFCDARLVPLGTPLSPEAAPPPADQPGIVRCPACGKPNPDFLQVCQFCDARLKPLTTGESQAAPAGEPADTLDRLRAAVPPAEPEAETFGPAPTQQEPDWMWTGVAEGESAPTAPAADDWMSSLRGAGAVPAEPAAEDTSEWMRSLRSAAAAPAPAEPAEEVPDWMSALRSADGAPAAAPAREAEIPDWLKSAPGAPAEPEPSAPPAATPDWMSAAASTKEEIPDWMKSFSGAEAAPPGSAAAPAEEIPDWLKSMQGAPAEPEPSAPPAVMPDWMSAAPAPPAPAAAPVEEVPDWLKSMQGAGLEPDPAAPAFTPEPAGGEPDWLSSPRGAETTVPPAEPEASPFAPEPAGGEPDWLNSLRGVETTAPPAEPEASPFAPEPAGGEPDWLNSLRGVETTAPPAELEASPFAPEPAGGEPDWLNSLRDAGTEPSTPAVSPFATDSFVSPFTDQPPEAPTVETAGPMPDWLAAMRPGDLGSALADIPATPAARPPRSPIVGESAAGLVQTALPSWLEALRPVDVARGQVAPEVDTYEETVGVLAGMRGVLRAEPTVAIPRKSTVVQIHQLDVSDLHASQAELLTRLLTEEAQAHPEAARGVRLALPLERWLIFALLAVAILAPFFLGAGLFPLPATIGVEAKAAYNVIEGLPAGKPALVAFDYDPAQTGELNPAASALVAHLMRRGLPVVAVSTRLTGAAVGEDVLQQLAADLNTKYGISYTYGVNYLNLGYLPGGSVGLLQFAAQPRSLFLTDFGGSAKVWETSLMGSVQALSDFGLILLITDAPESARAWVEQTRGYAGAVPMLAAVSAGAEPLVRPYYEADPPQISGLVSGLRGATQYEQQAGAPSAAGERWDMFGSGLLAAVVLIAAGNVINGVASLLRRRKK